MSRFNFARVLNVSHASGQEINVNLFLEEKPMREEQKCKTLIKYIEQYPSGWKKRLELADLFYGMGKWTEAIEQYYIVIERQPQLVPVKLKLGKILQLLGKKKDAIAIYENCLSLISEMTVSASVSLNLANIHQANQAHIIGLIAVCRQNLSQAVEAFSSAANLAPENASHWLALGKVHMELENNIDALQAFEEILSRYPEDLIALIHLYDVLIALGKSKVEFPANIRLLHQQSGQETTEHLWYFIAEQKLSQAIALAPNNYQVLKRQIISRCRKKLVLGKEGKQTKKLLSILSKIAPNSLSTQQLKNHYDQTQAEAQEELHLINQNNINGNSPCNIIFISG